jgi:hypothetical protein
MSVEFKAVTNFLRSVATAAKVMADALEQAEKDLAGAKGGPAVLLTEPLKGLSGAEQDDLAKDAAEFGSEKRFLDGMDVSKILVKHGCPPIWGGMSLSKYQDELLKKEIEIRELEKSGRLLDRFLAQRLKNPAKTCIGAERVKGAHEMSILTSVIVVGEGVLDFPTKNLEIENIRADSEDAKRLPEGAKIVGLMRYAVQFE